MGSSIGYARASSDSQSVDIQVEKLRAAGCQVIRSEIATGANRTGRTELATILDFVRPDDTVTVVRLDRLARSARDVYNIIHEIHERGASLRVLEPAISTDGPLGKTILGVLAMVAEMELSFIRERQRAGITAAKLKGVYRGRPITLDHQKIREMKRIGMGVTEIAEAAGCSRGAVYKILRQGQTQSSENRYSGQR
jgi:DNA invertase Pin-like site-specific DNA recombinase